VEEHAVEGPSTEAVDASDAPRAPDEVQAFFADWLARSNAGDWAGLGELMAPDVVLADPMAPEPARGREETLVRAAAQYEPFPDGEVVLLGAPFVSVAEPELTYRWRFRGTHLRPIDPPGFAPTDQVVEVEGTSVLRFRAGQVVDVRMFFDATEVARQILAAPPAGSRLEPVIAASQRLRVRARRLRSPRSGR
jgi:ketosteroid isomerase-like protein